MLMTGTIPDAHGTGHVGPRLQGRPGVLHVARPPGGLQGRELHADADERDLLDGEEGRAGEVIGYNDAMKRPIDPRRIEVIDPMVASILCAKAPHERVAMVGQANRTARLLLQAQIKRMNPDWSEEQVLRKLPGGWRMEQTDLLKYVLDALETRAIPYMVVGSFASSTYGETRFTFDIDVVIELNERDVPGFVAAFPDSDFYRSPEAIRDAIRQRFQFNVIHTASGNKIDFMLPRSDEWGRVQMARRRWVLLLPDREGFAAAPEDVILAKLWYFAEGGSDKHLRDIASMLRVSGSQIDRADVEAWACKLGLEEAWAAVLQREAT